MKTLFATAAVAALSLAACGGDEDISPETLTEALVAQGLEESIASCISETISNQVSTDEFNQIALAQDASDMTDEQFSLITDAAAECAFAEE